MRLGAAGHGIRRRKAAAARLLEGQMRRRFVERRGKENKTKRRDEMRTGKELEFGICGCYASFTLFVCFFSFPCSPNFFGKKLIHILVIRDLLSVGVHGYEDLSKK